MSNIYESRKLLDEYLLFHYGEPAEVLPWPRGPREALGFAVRSVTELGHLPVGGPALDLGCAVGRSSFELAKHTTTVLGIDFSQSFVNAANTLRDRGRLPYERLDEAAATTDLFARVPAECPRDHVCFEQGDAMNLPSTLGPFDLVHAANLLCRLTHPQRLLDRLPALVSPGGQLLLTTPCTWLAEYTPPENWPTGSTRDWLTAALSPHFTLEFTTDLPFLIREHARKYQWSVALGMRWRRKEPS